jgi:predicted O-linked N-acetylglucosamine transferase (SPINDLY family)
MDVALGPLPYNGTTTCEALWMGVPVVALAGEVHAARMGVSLLTRAGLPELIAPAPEDYVGIAASLAGDKDRLTRLRAVMRDRLRGSTLLDGVGFARSFEAGVRDAWCTWCAGDRTA